MIILITGASHTGKTLFAQNAGEQVVLIESDYEQSILELLASDGS